MNNLYAVYAASVIAPELYCRIERLPQHLTPGAVYDDAETGQYQIAISQNHAQLIWNISNKPRIRLLRWLGPNSLAHVYNPKTGRLSTQHLSGMHFAEMLTVSKEQP